MSGSSKAKARISKKAASEVGKRVSWQQLGEEFKDHTFCFRILDEKQENGRDWKDELGELLSAV